MQLGRIVLKLRATNTSLGSNIFGAAELNLAVSNTLTGKSPVAFVVPIEEEVRDNQTESGVNQLLMERFSVIVALPTDTTQKDKTGIIAYDALHNMRAEIFKPLIGWDMGYDGLIFYRSGKMLGIDRGWLWYDFEFELQARIISNPDGYGEVQYTQVDDRQQPSQLPTLDHVYAQYILSPSVNLTDVLNDPSISLPINLVTPDMTQMVDLTIDNKAGAFAKAFARAMKIFIG